MIVPKGQDEALYKLIRRRGERIVYDLIQLNGKPIKEIAVKLGISTFSVLVIVGRMKKVGLIKEVRIK